MTLLTGRDNRLIVYVPLAAYGYSTALRSGTISLWSALLAFVVGASYQFWDALYLNRGVRKV